MSDTRLKSSEDIRMGWVKETRGRRVLVEDVEGERVCFLSGHRAVVGDRVDWVVAQGEGGKIVGIQPRETVFERVDLRGRRQVLAANLGGLVVVTCPSDPPFRAGLLDRYVVSAHAANLDVLVLVNKLDLGIPEDVQVALDVRREVGLPVQYVSTKTGEGLAEFRAWLTEATTPHPWVLVGHSGVGKTSLMSAILPGTDVGAVGEVSAHWGTGQHTTSSSRWFQLEGGGGLVDSPGIRTFAPAGLEPDEVRVFFPGVSQLACRYRDCCHREGEDGCAGVDGVDRDLLSSYRRLYAEMEGIAKRTRR